WSPDGKYIAFNALPSSEFYFDDQSDFYLVKMPSEELLKIETDSYATTFNAKLCLVWSSDSKFLFYYYNVRGDTNVWTLRVENNSGATQVTAGHGEIHDMALSPTGERLAYVRSTQTRPGELMTIPLKGGQERQLTNWATQYQGLQD